MTLDPFTIFAQVFNFLVLLLLLRHFLYGPIVRTMDERELHITRELDEAERKDSEAKQEASRLHTEREEFEDRRGELLTQAQQDAEKLHGELIVQARKEVEARRLRWQSSIEREKASFLGNLRRRAGEQVYDISRRVLADLANIELERHIIDTFISRLSAMEVQKLENKADETEFRVGHDEAVVSTAFEIDEETRERIAAAAHSRLGENLALSFEETPDLICGIELKSRGFKAAWSLQNYLETLDENLTLAFGGMEEEQQA